MTAILDRFKKILYEPDDVHIYDEVVYEYSQTVEFELHDATDEHVFTWTVRYADSPQGRRFKNTAYVRDEESKQWLSVLEAEDEDRSVLNAVPYKWLEDMLLLPPALAAPQNLSEAEEHLKDCLAGASELLEKLDEARGLLSKASYSMVSVTDVCVRTKKRCECLACRIEGFIASSASFGRAWDAGS